jgi:3-oxoacyl-[acyl-carrier-protein] synthase III
VRSPDLLWPDARAAVREAAASDPAAAATATPMPWERRLRAAALASVAMAVPDRVVTNEAIAAQAGVTEQWIVHRTGVHERRHVSDGERLEDLAATAGRRALEGANVAPEDVDLVLVATLAADELTPNAAPLVAHRLGATRAGAMDVSAACTGFLSGLQLAAAQVEGGRCDHVLLIGADVLSRFVDSSDRGTAALFADGAGAALVAPAGDGGAGLGGRIGDIVLHCDGSGADSIKATHEEQLIRMQGHDTFKAAVQRMSEATVEATHRAGLHLGDIELFVFHQANARILAAVGERLGLPGERVINSIDRYGNTSAATLPIAMADARERGMLEPGMNVLLAAFGAGFTWGAGVIEWAA